MARTKLKEYLKDGKGNPSSTRLFSWLFMWYFFLINIMIFLLVFLGKSNTLDVNTIVFVSTHDFLVLLAIFAPKALHKIEEIKELIAIAKFKYENGNTEVEDNSEEIG